VTARRVLIGQIACFGDILYATTIARQIKHDTPDAHITWAVAAKYRSILDHNPDIDSIWELPIHTRDITKHDWIPFEKEAEARRIRGEFTEILYTQIIDTHIEKFLTTLRQTVFRIFGQPITVDVRGVVRLTDEERARVRTFVDTHALTNYRHVVLFECTPSSLQSKLSIDFALSIAQELTARHPDVAFVLSSHQKIPTGLKRVFSAQELSYRENAELTKYCTMLIGCSSGITWLATSGWARRLPMLQLLDERSQIFCGITFDHELNGLDTSTIIEMTRYDLGQATACAEQMLAGDVAGARTRFHQVYRPNRWTLTSTAIALWHKERRSLGGMWKFINEYIRENARLGNDIKVNRLAVLASIVLEMLRNSPHPIMRTGRRAVRRLREFWMNR